MGQQDIDPIVRISHVYLSYANGRNRGTTIINDASFSIQRGEKFVIIGPSGCGKTTLLNAIAGFLKPYQGQIFVKDDPITGPGPDRAVVFQHFEQLFAWRTVLGNIVYALQITKHISKQDATEKARSYLELVDVAEEMLGW